MSGIYGASMFGLDSFLWRYKPYETLETSIFIPNKLHSG